jgi:hypothetical protein
MRAAIIQNQKRLESGLSDSLCRSAMKTAVPLRLLAHLALATLLGSCADPVSYQLSEERAVAATSYAQAPRDRPGLGTRSG